MVYSKSDVLTYVSEEDVKFIRLVFCDYNGVQKNISIMPNELEKVFEKGFKVDSSLVCGYEKYKKIVLIPDSNTASILPWRPSQGRVIRMFCDIKVEDESFISPRSVLKNAIEECNIEGIKFFQQFEFYTLKLDEQGNNTYIPYDNGSIMDIAPIDKGEKIRRDICLNLSEMGIETCGSHHSYGPGQNRICLVPTSPLVAAENSITFESVTKTLTSINGLEADFSSLPIDNNIPSIQIIGISLPSDKLDECYSNLKDNFAIILKYLDNKEAKFEDVVELDEEILIKGVSYSSNFYLFYSDILNSLMSK